MGNKNELTMNESMFSQIDLIRQDSKDVRDFVKKVFSDKEFKSMSKDTDFIKYLKSIYEGTVLDEEHVKFSNRTSTGTITTGSVQTTSNESITEAIKLSKKQIDVLRNGYDKINKINPSSPIYKRLTGLLDKLSKTQLQQLGNAKIKFVSSLALNRINRKRTEETINEAIKGKNNKTGESFGMVIGSDKKNREGNFEVTIRKTYSSRSKRRECAD